MNTNTQKSDVRIPDWYKDSKISLDMRMRSFQIYHRRSVEFLLGRYILAIKKKKGVEISELTRESNLAISNDNIEPNSYSEEILGNLIKYHKGLVGSLIEGIRGIPKSNH